MTELLLGEAMRALAVPGLHYEAAVSAVPPRPGLYAIYGSAEVWQQISLGDPPDDRPLYVGKAERSLLGRDLRTHFRTGCTGSSTVRRSLAALLRDDLRLVAQPRSLDKPDHFANYGLEPDGEARLTTWMIEHLRLATWEAPPGTVLRDIEQQVLGRLLPPLNQDNAPTPWRPQIKAARRAMADQARGVGMARPASSPTPRKGLVNYETCNCMISYYFAVEAGEREPLPVDADGEYVGASPSDGCTQCGGEGVIAASR